jgi:hypothetical protein
MSFAVTAIDAITVNSTVEQPPAGSTVTLTADVPSKTVAITDSASENNPVVFKLEQSFISDTNKLLAIAIATAKAEIKIEGGDLPKSLSSRKSVEITIGKDDSGNFLEIGGMVIRGSTANGLTISLAGGLATVTVPPDKIPDTFQKIFQFGLSRASLANALQAPSLNTATELSLGDDSYLGTEFNDGIVLSKGKDVMVGGGGDDIFAASASLKGAKSKITLDGSGDNAGADGSDQVVLAKGALKQGKAKIILSDFDSKRDTIGLETKRSKVSGLGTDQLKISTKNGKVITIESDGSKFSKGSVEFI